MSSSKYRYSDVPMGISASDSLSPMGNGQSARTPSRSRKCLAQRSRLLRIAGHSRRAWCAAVAPEDPIQKIGLETRLRPVHPAIDPRPVSWISRPEAIIAVARCQVTENGVRFPHCQIAILDDRHTNKWVQRPKRRLVQSAESAASRNMFMEEPQFADQPQDLLNVARAATSLEHGEFFVQRWLHYKDRILLPEPPRTASDRVGPWLGMKLPQAALANGEHVSVRTAGVHEGSRSTARAAARMSAPQR